MITDTEPRRLHPQHKAYKVTDQDGMYVNVMVTTALLHDEAIRQEQWVMDGNYTRTLPQRLSRATGVILLDISTTTSLWRYLRRTWFEPDRKGALGGGKDSVKWQMLHHIAIVTPRNRRRYADLYEQLTIPKCKLTTTKDLNLFYQAEQLVRR